jgi:hypothetical protein
MGIENFKIFWKIDSGTKKFGDHKGLKNDDRFSVPEEVVLIIFLKEGFPIQDSKNN